MGTIDVRGALDLHCHSAPALFPRVGDAWDISQRAAEAGMRGILFKSHHTTTYDRAYAVNTRMAAEAEDGARLSFEAFGAVTLNHYVGGINPTAVSGALRQGCRAVFMPSLDAAYHARVMGGAGQYGIASMTMRDPRPERGLTVFDGDGNLSAETLEVIDLVAQHGAVLGTSHLSPNEQLAVAREGAARGAKVIATHAFFLPGIDLAFCRAMADAGAVVELAAVALFPMTAYQAQGLTLKQARELTETVGPRRCILSTDAGQLFNPWPHEALRITAQLLHEVGVREEDLHEMIVEGPRRLLGLDTRPAGGPDSRS